MLFRSRQIRSAAHETDAKAFHDPAINPLGDRGEGVMDADDRGFVNFVEVKTVRHRAGQCAEFLRQRIALGFEIKFVSGEIADDDSSNSVKAAVKEW